MCKNFQEILVINTIRTLLGAALCKALVYYLVALKVTEQFFWFVQRVLLFIRGNKNEHRNSVFLYYVSVCIRNSQKVCVDVLGGFCFVFKMPPNWANNIKMRMACGSLNGCELNSHLSSALCTAALLSIYYVDSKKVVKKFFLVF